MLGKKAAGSGITRGISVFESPGKAQATAALRSALKETPQRHVFSSAPSK